MSSQRVSPFKGTPKADTGGGDWTQELPSENTHEARIVALIDLGTHPESFKGEPEKDNHKCILVYELDEDSSIKGVNHVICVKYTLSTHEKASLRKLAEAILLDGRKYPEQTNSIDYELLLGQPCTVQISHKTGQGEKADRTYPVIGTIGPVARKYRAKVFEPQRVPFAWYVGDDLADLPTWLPRSYSEPIVEIVKRCNELRGQPQPASQKQNGQKKAVAAERHDYPDDGYVSDDEEQKIPF